MADPRDGALRLARGLAVAVAAVALAAGAHLLAGGDLPPALLLAGVLVAAATTGHAVTARRTGPAAAVALLGAGQLALHTAFTVLAPGAAPLPGSPPLVAAGHAHGGGHAGEQGRALAGALAGGGLDAVADAGGGLLMLLAHGVATVLVGAALAGADRSLWLLLAWLAPLVVLLVVRARPVLSPARRAVAGTPARTPRQPALGRTTSRRGPPRRALTPA